MIGRAKRGDDGARPKRVRPVRPVCPPQCPAAGPAPRGRENRSRPPRRAGPGLRAETGKKIAAQRLFVSRWPRFSPLSRQPKRMAEKTACGCFLSLRNKKQLISMAPFLAAVAATETDGRKITAQRLFLSLRNKKQLISMAPFLAAVAATETNGRKITAQQSFFARFLFSAGHSLCPSSAGAGRPRASLVFCGGGALPFCRAFFLPPAPKRRRRAPLSQELSRKRRGGVRAGKAPAPCCPACGRGKRPDRLKTRFGLCLRPGALRWAADGRRC